MTDSERQRSYAHRDERREEVYAAVMGFHRWLIGSLLGSGLFLGGLTYHYAQTVSRVVALETEARAKGLRLDALSSRLTSAETIAAGVGARMDAQSRTLDRIETQLDRLNTRLDGATRP